MDFDKPPSLKEFDKALDWCVNETDCRLSKDGYIGSHEIVGHIDVVLEDSDDEYEIVGLRLDYLFGCGCPSGATIKIKKVE